MGQAVLHAQQQAPLQAIQALLQAAVVGGQQLGGGRRGGRAHVGDEVADRYVGFMAHGADYRGDAGGHGTRHGFFVEAPQVSPSLVEFHFHRLMLRLQSACSFLS